MEKITYHFLWYIKEVLNFNRRKVPQSSVVIRFDKDQETSNCDRRAVARSVERTTPGEEVLSSIIAVAARSLLVGSVSV